MDLEELVGFGKDLVVVLFLAVCQPSGGDLIEIVALLEQCFGDQLQVFVVIVACCFRHGQRITAVTMCKGEKEKEKDERRETRDERRE